MDIPELSMALSMNKVQTDFGTAMLAKQLDTFNDIGASMVDGLNDMTKEMELSVNPSVGSNVDFSV